MLTEVQQHNFIILAAQYAVGKDSQTVCEFVETLLLSWQSITQVTRDTLISFIEHEVDLHHKNIKESVKDKTSSAEILENINKATNLGLPYDADVWIRLLNFMKRNKTYGKGF